MSAYFCRPSFSRVDCSLTGKASHCECEECEFKSRQSTQIFEHFMSNQNNKKYHIRKRLFLSRNSENPDYVIAIVEDTKDICDDCENESWKWSHIDLSIGNGYDQISINFSMETHEDRSESICKIRRLSKALNRHYLK